MIQLCMTDIKNLGCMQTCKTRVAQLSYRLDGIDNLLLIETPINCDELCDLGRKTNDPIEAVEAHGQKDRGRSVAELMRETAMMDFFYSNSNKRVLFIDSAPEIVSRVCEIMVEV